MKGVLVDIFKRQIGKPLTVNEVRVCPAGHIHYEGKALLMPGNKTEYRMGDVKITVEVDAS